MSYLVEIRFTHYAPKDIEEGIREFVVTNDLKKVDDYVDKEYLYGALAQDYTEEDSYSPTDEWWKENSHKRMEMEELGLTIDEYGTVSGTREALTRWLKSNSWLDVRDARYGVTRYDWSKVQTITDTLALAMVEIGVAKKI